jgi:gamma-glutamylcyclotransferase (GGCT)/AIG2-like uncharacterized protein YtfP
MSEAVNGMKEKVWLASGRAVGFNVAVHLFTYGTLMFNQVWRQVVGRLNPSLPATLEGHRIGKITGQVFPGMTICPGGRVSGRAWWDVTPGELALLDEFESGLYERMEVPAILLDGSRRSCWAYLVRPEHQGMLLEERWDPAEFEHLHLATYLL